MRKINDGARKEDIAASIFQAVVNQTISGLAAGHKISGNVAFLGGPLYFMDQLRQRFIKTLHLTDEEVIFPASPQLFVAQGAALYAADQPELTLTILLDRLENGDASALAPSHSLAPLFENEDQNWPPFASGTPKTGSKPATWLTTTGRPFWGLTRGPRLPKSS